MRTGSFFDLLGPATPGEPGLAPDEPDDGPQEPPAAHQDAPVHAAPLGGGGELGRREQAAIAARYAARQAKRNWNAARKHPGGVLAYLEHYGETVAEQAAYMRSKAWVPAGHEGGLADTSGTAYHRWIGIPLACLFMFSRWVVARPFRCCVAAGLLAVGLGAAGAVLANYGILHL